MKKTNKREADKLPTSQAIISHLKRIERKLDKIDAHGNYQSKEFLTTNEAMHFLGCSRVVIWRLVNENMLPQHKMGKKRVYYSVVDLKKLIALKDTEKLTHEIKA